MSRSPAAPCFICQGFPWPGAVALVMGCLAMGSQFTLLQTAVAHSALYWSRGEMYENINDRFRWSKCLIKSDISFDWGDPLWPLEHIVRRVSPLVPWCSRTTRMAWILVRYLPVLRKESNVPLRWESAVPGLCLWFGCNWGLQSAIFQFRSTAGWDQNIYLFRLTWKTKPGFKHETNQRHRDAWPCGGSLGCKTVQGHRLLRWSHWCHKLFVHSICWSCGVVIPKS